MPTPGVRSAPSCAFSAGLEAARGRAKMDEILGRPDPFFIHKFGELPLWALREAIGKLPKMGVDG